MHPNPRPKDWAGLLCFIMASDKKKIHYTCVNTNDNNGNNKKKKDNNNNANKSLSISREN